MREFIRDLHESGMLKAARVEERTPPKGPSWTEVEIHLKPGFEQNCKVETLDGKGNKVLTEYALHPDLGKKFVLMLQRERQEGRTWDVSWRGPDKLVFSTKGGPLNAEKKREIEDAIRTLQK
jgi:hypothetical protein